MRQHEMKLNEEWEEFTAGPNEVHGTRIHVTINRHGSIFFNRNTYNLLGRPEAVVLYYNRKQEKIAITSTHRRNTRGFPLVRHGDTTWRIQANPFCRRHVIRVNKTEKFVGAEVDDDAMLLLDLRNMISAARAGPRT